MKLFSCFPFLFFLILSPFLLKGQIACGHGISPEICSANIPADAIVIMGNDTLSNSSQSCYWVCPGDSLVLYSASECFIYLEPQARLVLGGNGNRVWAKSESRVEILANSINNILGILEDVIYIDEGINTDETICGISSGVNLDYTFAPEDGCDLTSVSPDIESALIQLYPNPVNGKTSISLSLPKVFYGEIYLSDSYGRVVKKWKSEGQQSLDLPLENTIPGIYLIHVPNTSLVKKIVVF